MNKAGASEQPSESKHEVYRPYTLFFGLGRAKNLGSTPLVYCRTETYDAHAISLCKPSPVYFRNTAILKRASVAGRAYVGPNGDEPGGAADLQKARVAVDNMTVPVSA